MLYFGQSEGRLYITSWIRKGKEGGSGRARLLIPPLRCKLLRYLLLLLLNKTVSFVGWMGIIAWMEFLSPWFSENSDGTEFYR